MNNSRLEKKKKKYNPSWDIDSNLLTMYDESFNHFQFDLKLGDLVNGVILSITDDWVELDIAYRDNLYVSKQELKGQDLSIGDYLECKIVRLNDSSTRSEFSLIGSVKEFNKDVSYYRLYNSDSKDIFKGVVTHKIYNAGYNVNIDGVDCFLPISHILGLKQSEIIGSEIEVLVINKQSRGIVVSHKKCVEYQAPLKKMEELELHKLYVGEITGIMRFGVFVNFEDYFSGLLHVNMMDELSRQLFNNHQLNKGDDISFRIQQIKSTSKMDLYQGPPFDLWKEMESHIENQTEFEGTVSSITSNGLKVKFLNKIEGVYFLNKNSDYKFGDNLKVKVILINKQSNKIYLDII